MSGGAWRQAHPDTALIERFLLGQTSEAENMPIVRHLMVPCPRCHGVVRRVLSRSGSPLALLLLRDGMEAQP